MSRAAAIGAFIERLRRAPALALAAGPPVDPAAVWATLGVLERIEPDVRAPVDGGGAVFD